MKKFEYKVSPWDVTEEMLNSYGIDGWELVAIHRGDSIFKREKKN